MSDSHQPPAPALCILALDLQPALAALVPDGARVHEARFEALDSALLARLRPDRVLLPLMTPEHDAIQMIEQLCRLGYGGMIVVVAPPLPQPRMVERELRNLGPGQRLILLTP